MMVKTILVARRGASLVFTGAKSPSRSVLSPLFTLPPKLSVLAVATL